MPEKPKESGISAKDLVFKDLDQEGKKLNQQEYKRHFDAFGNSFQPQEIQKVHKLIDDIKKLGAKDLVSYKNSKGEIIGNVEGKEAFRNNFCETLDNLYQVRQSIQDLLHDPKAPITPAQAHAIQFYLKAKGFGNKDGTDLSTDGNLGGPESNTFAAMRRYKLYIDFGTYRKDGTEQNITRTKDGKTIREDGKIALDSSFIKARGNAASQPSGSFQYEGKTYYYIGTESVSGESASKAESNLQKAEQQQESQEKKIGGTYLEQAKVFLDQARQSYAQGNESAGDNWIIQAKNALNKGKKFDRTFLDEVNAQKIRGERALTGIYAESKKADNGTEYDQLLQESDRMKLIETVEKPLVNKLAQAQKLHYRIKNELILGQNTALKMGVEEATKLYKDSSILLEKSFKSRSMSQELNEAYKVNYSQMFKSIQEGLKDMNYYNDRVNQMNQKERNARIADVKEQETSEEALLKRNDVIGVFAEDGVLLLKNTNGKIEAHKNIPPEASSREKMELVKEFGSLYNKVIEEKINRAFPNAGARSTKEYQLITSQLQKQQKQISTDLENAQELLQKVCEGALDENKQPYLMSQFETALLKVEQGFGEMNMIPSRIGKNNIEFIKIDALHTIFEQIQTHKQTGGKAEFLGKEYTKTQNAMTEALKTSGRNIGFTKFVNDFRSESNKYDEGQNDIVAQNLIMSETVALSPDEIKLKEDIKNLTESGDFLILLSKMHGMSHEERLNKATDFARTKNPLLLPFIEQTVQQQEHIEEASKQELNSDAMKGYFDAIKEMNPEEKFALAKEVNSSQTGIGQIAIPTLSEYTQWPPEKQQEWDQQIIYEYKSMLHEYNTLKQTANSVRRTLYTHTLHAKLDDANFRFSPENRSKMEQINALKAEDRRGNGVYAVSELTYDVAISWPVGGAIGKLALRGTQMIGDMALVRMANIVHKTNNLKAKRAVIDFKNTFGGKTLKFVGNTIAESQGFSMGYYLTKGKGMGGTDSFGEGKFDISNLGFYTWTNTWNTVFQKFGPQMDTFFKYLFKPDHLKNETMKKAFSNLAHDIKNTLLIHTSNEFGAVLDQLITKGNILDTSVSRTREELIRALWVKTIAGKSDSKVAEGLEKGKLKISKKGGKFFITDIIKKAALNSGETGVSLTMMAG